MGQSLFVCSSGARLLPRTLQLLRVWSPMVKLRPDAVECRTMQSFVFSSASEAAASAAADAAAALNVPIGAQLSIAAVAAAKIAIDLAISQDDAADAAASCTERITQSMGQDADTRAQAADTTAIITGYLVASHAGEGPIAAGLEAGKAMRAAGSLPQEQLSAAADAALHAASAANLPKELQLVAATASIGRAAAVGRIRTSKDEFRKLILCLAAQLAIVLPSYGVDEARPRPKANGVYCLSCACSGRQ